MFADIALYFFLFFAALDKPWRVYHEGMARRNGEKE